MFRSGISSGPQAFQPHGWLYHFEPQARRFGYGNNILVGRCMASGCNLEHCCRLPLICLFFLRDNIDNGFSGFVYW